MDQVLVVLVAEEALAQLGQPVLSALQGAHELLLPVAQQDVVVGPLADEGLVVIEVLAGRPQAQVGVVVLARPGQLPVRAREQRVGPRPRRRFSATAPSAPVRARAPPSAASVICCPAGHLCGLELVLHGFAWRLTFSQAVCAVTDGENSSFGGTVKYILAVLQALVTHEAALQGVVEVVGLGHVQHDFAWHGMILLDFGMT